MEPTILWPMMEAHYPLLTAKSIFDSKLTETNLQTLFATYPQSTQQLLHGWENNALQQRM